MGCLEDNDVSIRPASQPLIIIIIKKLNTFNGTQHPGYRKGKA